MTFRSFFKIRNLLKWRKASKAPGGVNMDSLLALVDSPGFDEFLKYLSLTVEDKAYILTTMDLFNEKQRQEAIKIQYAMRGILMVEDIVADLKYQAKEKLKNEMGK